LAATETTLVTRAAKLDVCEGKLARADQRHATLGGTVATFADKFSHLEKSASRKQETVAILVKELQLATDRVDAFEQDVPSGQFED